MKLSTAAAVALTAIALTALAAPAGAAPPSARMLPGVDTPNIAAVSIQGRRFERPGRDDRRRRRRRNRRDLDQTDEPPQSDVFSPLDRVTRGAFIRHRNVDRRAQIARGLAETGLVAVFPDEARCRGVDETYAIDYAWKRGGRNVVHGGIDIPAPRGTPIVAIAAGTVVATFTGKRTRRGFELVLRHAPREIGLPFWVYTQYAHLRGFPSQRIGQRVRMGAVIGYTSNTGFQPRRRRRDALHLGVFYSRSPRFLKNRRLLIPLNGHWMDPHALYRGRMPVDSRSMKTLPRANKRIRVPVMLAGGATIPARTKLVWPYRCRRR